MSLRPSSPRMHRSIRLQKGLGTRLVTTKPWLRYCDSRFGLPLSLTSSTLRVQLPFTVSLKGATRASYFWVQARRSCDEAGARATHDLDYPCSLPRQHSEGSYRLLRTTWTTPVPKLPRQVGCVMLTSNLWVV